MKKFFTVWKKYSLLTIFVIGTVGIGVLNISNLYSAVKQQYISRSLDMSVMETAYNNNFWKRLTFVNIQGLVSRVSGQKICNGVVKGTDGKLNLKDDLDYKFSEKVEHEKVERAGTILKHAKETGADVLYVQRPWATGPLPYGYKFELEDQFTYWCQEMKKMGIPILDLRSKLGDRLKFYTTDHHWTIESSFYANQMIIGQLNQRYGLHLDPYNKYTDIKYYEKKRYENSFLGSEGIRVGKYFAGKDDFETVVPKFETWFTYEQYTDHQVTWQSEGSYETVFINREKLEDSEYNNKYATILFDGYIENRILNHQVDNNKKVLLIADSYARPMVTYLACNFKETRYLDPQEGRYTESYVEYINNYKPDVVIMMFSGDGSFKKI